MEYSQANLERAVSASCENSVSTFNNFPLNKQKMFSRCLTEAATKVKAGQLRKQKLEKKFRKKCATKLEGEGVRPYWTGQ